MSRARAARRAAERTARKARGARRDEERFRILQSTLTDLCTRVGPPPTDSNLLAVAYMVKNRPVVRLLDLENRIEIVLSPGAGDPPMDRPTLALPLKLPPAQPDELRAVLALADAYRLLSISFRGGPVTINAPGGTA
ncbi:hypothetical protein WMF18_17180 [Sorangium sp. So ce315]|uniref:hypothetical protein n=1 Tax=Sorangium sp. So ce315 TaxID=3133299 RepID=UPI003F6088A7